MKRMDKISRLRDSVSEKVFKVLFLEKQLPVDDVSKRGIRAPSAAASGRFAQVDPHLKFREFRFAIAFENRKINWYITEKLVNAFLGGTVLPTRQVGEGIPVKDPDGKAIDLIRTLSADDFPGTAVQVARDGSLQGPR